MRSTVPAVARIVKRMADGLYARQLNLCQVPVCRLTGQVDPSTHLPGNGMLCSGCSFSMESMQLALA
jgi:hypothetical protein